MATVTIDYFGMSGTGRNVTEAKRDAGRRIEKAMNGDYTPFILQAGDETIVGHRDPRFEWEYAFVRDGQLSGGSTCIGGRDECERRARRHLGDIATDWRTCLTPADVHPIVLDADDRKDVAQRCQWQRDYHAARAAGLDDNNARYFIGGFTQFMTQPIPAVA